MSHKRSISDSSLSHTYGEGGVSQSKLTGMRRYILANIVDHATEENHKTRENLKNPPKSQFFWKDCL